MIFSDNGKLRKRRHSESKKDGKDQERYNQVPHLTPDTTRESNTTNSKHHKQDLIGQPFSSR